MILFYRLALGSVSPG